MAKENQHIEKAILMDDTEIEYVWTDNPPRGGMKHTYFTPDRKFAIQFFNKREDAESSQMKARLENIVGLYNPTLSEEEGGAIGNTRETAAYFSNLYCWPAALIKSPQFGVVCPVYPPNFFFGRHAVKNGVNLDLAGKDKKSRWFTSRTSKWLADDECGNFQTMLRLSISLARAVRRLHTAGLSHSDLSSNNVLIDPRTGTCVVIDIDSLVVPGLFPPEVAGTKGYIAPEVLETMELPFDDPGRKLPCAATDLFALPVLLYEYLLRRHPLDGPKIYSTASTEEDEFLQYGPKATFIENPQDTSNRPDDLQVSIHDLGPHLEKLFLQAFVDGMHDPEKRPTAAQWEKALVKTWDLLQPCRNPNCRGKWFILHDLRRPVCPHCGQRIDAGGVMHLRLKKPMRGRRGQWQQVGEINLYDKMPLFQWHFVADVYPDEKMQDRSMQAYISHQGEAWYLVNNALTGMLSPKGNLVPVGQAVWLRDGAMFPSCNKQDALLLEAVKG
ncbi:MAG: serine/threonine protein kinase [Selenomonadaceae bacterium]|nr:serine/threonine protein kinase [Selenomonadaceae bacterium]